MMQTINAGAQRIGFLTFEQMCGKLDLGSSRIRAHAIIRHWASAERFRIGQPYTAVVFQKAYWVEYATSFQGIKILDLCDPDLLNWNSRCIAMAGVCDAIVTSTEALAQLVRRYTSTPAVCIPDRIDFAEIGDRRKLHLGNGPTRTAVWFGYSANFPSLDCAVPHLLNSGIQNLIVVANADMPYWPPLEFYGSLRVTNYPWSVATFYDHLLEADIAINFRLDSGRWKYKSNNKTTLAWALGLPVARTATELSSLLSEQDRTQEANLRYQEVRRDYDVRQSVQDYKSLIDAIYSARKDSQSSLSGSHLENSPK